MRLQKKAMLCNIYQKNVEQDDRIITSITDKDIYKILEPIKDKPNISKKVYLTLKSIFKYAVEKDYL